MSAIGVRVGAVTPRRTSGLRAAALAAPCGVCRAPANKRHATTRKPLSYFSFVLFRNRTETSPGPPKISTLPPRSRTLAKALIRFEVVRPAPPAPLVCVRVSLREGRFQHPEARARSTHHSWLHRPSPMPKHHLRRLADRLHVGRGEVLALRQPVQGIVELAVMDGE
jgi:hypothetical protein